MATSTTAFLVNDPEWPENSSPDLIVHLKFYLLLLHLMFRESRKCISPSEAGRRTEWRGCTWHCSKTWCESWTSPHQIPSWQRYLFKLNVSQLFGQSVYSFRAWIYNCYFWITLWVYSYIFEVSTLIEAIIDHFTNRPSFRKCGDPKKCDSVPN